MEKREYTGYAAGVLTVEIIVISAMQHIVPGLRNLLISAAR